MPKTAVIHIRISPEDKKLLQEIADEDKRTLSALASKVLVDFAKSRRCQ